MPNSGVPRLYDLLDSLVALRIEYATETEGDQALVVLGRPTVHQVRTILDKAIASTKQLIGNVPRPEAK